MKKLPPFGKSLNEIVQKGFRPTNSINLFIGHNAWNKGQNFSISYPTRTLVLPPWLSPSNFYWPVTQCDVLIFDTGYADIKYVEDLVFSLYSDRADIVRYISPEFTLTVYRKE